MPPIGHMDWIGCRKFDPCPTLRQTGWPQRHVALQDRQESRAAARKPRDAVSVLFR